MEALLSELRSAPGCHDRYVRRAPLRALGGLLGGVCGVVVAIVFAVWMQWFWLFFLGPFALMAGIMVLAIRSTATGVLQYDAQRVLALSRALEALGPELAKDAKIDLELDLRGYQGARAKVEARSRFGIPSVVVYEQRWLQASLRLLDGTKVDLVATTVAKRKQRVTPKWFKKKDRVKDVLRVVIRLKDHAPHEDAGARAAARAKSIMGLTLRAARLKPRALELVFVSGMLQRYMRQGTWRVQAGEGLLSAYGLLMGVVIAFTAATPMRPHA